MRSIRLQILGALFLMTLVVNSLYGQSWTSLNGPVRGNVNVADITAGIKSGDPQPTFYDIEGATIYKSTTAGSSWSSVSSLYTGANPKLVVCQSDTPTHVVSASVDGSGYGSIHYSTNGGSNWDVSLDMNGDQNFSPNCMAGSPVSSTLLLVGAQKVCTHYPLLRSLDGGRHWSNVSTFYDTIVTHVTAVTWHRTNSSYALAGGTTSGSCGGSGTNGVFYSSNQGANWGRTGNNLTKNIKAVALYTKSGTTYALAATDESSYKLYYNSNPYSGSSTWTQRTGYPGGLITDLRVDANNAIYATSSDGVYKSTDDGANWSTCQASFIEATNFTRTAINPRNSDTLIAVSNVNAYRSTDGGSTWHDVARNTSTLSTRAVAANSSTVIGALKDYSLVDRNTGSGWYPAAISSCVTDFRGLMTGFQTSGGTTVFEAGYRTTGGTTASLLRSTNGGAAGSWSEVKTGDYTGGRYNGVAIDPANTSRVYAFGLARYSHSGSNENIGVSSDGGTGWNACTPIPDNSQSNIPEVADMVIDSTSHGGGSSNILYGAVYSSGLTRQGVWKSTNSGTSWNGTSLTKQVRAIAMNSKAAGTLYAAGKELDGDGGAEGMWKSTNSGSSWSQLTAVTQHVTRITMHPSYPTSANYVWMVDSTNSKIYKTKDGGSNWSEITTGLGTIYDLRTDLTSNRYFYVATSTGVHKIDPKPEAPPTPWLACVCDAGASCDGGGEGNLMSGVGEDDGGAQTNSGGTPHCYPQVNWNWAPEADVSTSGGKVKVYRSASAGSGYSLVATINYSTAVWVDYNVILPTAGTYYYKISYVDVGNNESDLSSYTTLTGSPKSVVPFAQLPENFHLAQNAPNPFNPSTRITFSIPVAGRVSLKLYDVLGREVASIIDGERIAGEQTVEFNAGALSSGMYFYRLEAAGQSEIRRMVLMK